MPDIQDLINECMELKSKWKDYDVTITRKKHEEFNTLTIEVV